MAITLGTPSNSGNQTNKTTFSFNHTCETQAKCLVVVITGYDSNSTDTTVTSCTYNGQTMTQIASGAYWVTSMFCTIFYLRNPNIGGAYSVSITTQGTCTDIQATAIALIDDTVGYITYDTSNRVNDTTTLFVDVVVSSVTTGAYAIGGVVGLFPTTGSIGVTTGSLITGSEADMGSQVAECATNTESGGSAQIKWNKSGSNSSIGLVATFKGVGNPRRIFIS
jgi:hypothetical protein